MSRNLKLLLIAAAGVIVVVVAVRAFSSGNGGTTTTASTAPSASALAWAGGVCSAFTDWRTSVVSAGKSVRANPTKAGIEQALADAKAATSTLTKELKALETPTTTGSTEARNALTQLKGELQNDVAVIQRTIDNPSSGTASAQASTIEAAFATMREQMTATGKELRALPAGEIEQAFNDAPACKPLQANSSS